LLVKGKSQDSKVIGCHRKTCRPKFICRKKLKSKIVRLQQEGSDVTREQESSIALYIMPNPFKI